MFAEAFIAGYVRNQGLPLSIVSDRDTRFTSKFWQALCALLRIKLEMSTAYHPQSNRQVEKANTTLETFLKADIAQLPRPEQWVCYHKLGTDMLDRFIQVHVCPISSPLQDSSLPDGILPDGRGPANSQLYLPDGTGPANSQLHLPDGTGPADSQLHGAGSRRMIEQDGLAMGI